MREIGGANDQVQQLVWVLYYVGREKRLNKTALVTRLLPSPPPPTTLDHPTLDDN